MLPMLQRLCWKEWRQGWPLLALGLVLPPLAVTLIGVKIVDTPPTSIVLFLLLMGVAIGAPLQVAEGRSGQSYAGRHFPLSPVWPSLLTFLWQGVIVALVGANVGWWYANMPHADLHAILVIVGILYFGAVYAFAVAVTRAINIPAGMAAGIILILVGQSWAFPKLTLGRWHDGPESYLLPAVAVASVIAVLLLLAPKKWIVQRRVIAIALLVVACVGTPIAQSTWLDRGGQANFFNSDLLQVSAPDGSVAVTPAPGNTMTGFPVILQLVDYRKNIQAVQKFSLPVIPIGLIDREAALLLTQKPGEKRITLLRWNLVDNSLSPLITFPARRNVIHDSLKINTMMDIRGSVSPDEQYVLILSPALIGDGSFEWDSWLVDLQTTTIKLVSAKTFTSYQEISWVADRVILSDSSSPIAISLPSGVISPYHIPFTLEER